MTATLVEPRDPRERFAKAPFEQAGSGSSNQLDPPADYGESTSRDTIVSPDALR